MTTERFKTRKEALTWLQARGQVSKSKFYRDCDDGLVEIGPDKTLSKFQVAEYAEREINHTRQTGTSLDMSEKKARLEVEKLEQEVEKGKLANRKEDEKWLYKEDAWAQMAAIIGKLKDALRHQFHIGSIIVITAAGGDPQRGPEVYETNEALLASAFNEVLAAGRIEGIFDKTSEEI
jgi:hypothetical protein